MFITVIRKIHLHLPVPLHTQVSLKQTVSCPSLHQVDLQSPTVAQRSENTKDDNKLNGANVSFGTIEASKYSIVSSLALCFATIHPEFYVQNQYKSFLPDETNKEKRSSCFIIFNNKVVIIIHYIDIMTYLDVN